MQPAHRRFIRWKWMITAMVMILTIGLTILWARSWSIQQEVRWMHDGVHHHLELAQGSVTYVVSSGWPSKNYIVWVTSPDLSYGRDALWYTQTSPGTRNWHLRVHWVVPPVLSILVLGAAARLLARGRRRNRRGASS